MTLPEERGFCHVDLSDDRVRLVAIGSAVQILVNAYNFVVNTPPIIGLDALIFQYSGWYVTQGGIVYSGIWDIKPPFIHYLAALVSVLTGGNMLALHFASTVLTGITFLLTSVLILEIVDSFTGNRQAAFVSSLLLFTFPPFYTFSARGLRPKLFVVLLGLVTVWYLIEDKPVRSALAGVIAAGLWQFGLVFPLVPTAYILYRREWKAAGAVALGTVALVGIAVAPSVYHGAVNQLIAEVVLAPLIATESLNYPFRLLKIGFFLKFASIPATIGGIGLLLAGTDETYGRPRWLPVFAAWFLIQILFLDLEGPPDLFVGFALSAVGFGIAVDRWEYETVSYAGISAIAVVMAGWLLYVLFTGDTFLWIGFSKSLVAEPAQQYSQTANLADLYWNQSVSNSCHLRLSGAEKEFMNIVGETKYTSTCGKYDLRRLIRFIVA